MKMRLLTVAVALASIIGVQQAVASDLSKPVAANKKHHKKHKKMFVANPSNPN